MSGIDEAAVHGPAGDGVTATVDTDAGSAAVEMIDGYGPLAPIGFGGFSTVYLAHQKIFDRRVAVKVLNADLRDADARRRFIRECHATGRLTGHPNIITVFDAGMTRDGRPYIAMEYAPGGSLRDRVKQAGPLAATDVRAIAAAVADALVAAHAAGILHRDLKPGNVLLREPGTAVHPRSTVLSDFGIASLDTTGDGLTISSPFTPGYAAPEVMQGDEHTEASDIFAFGATLFTLLAGRPPFPGRTPARILQLILEEPAPVLDRPSVPEDLAALVGRMLSVDPTRRPGSAAEVAAELASMAGAPVTEGPPRQDAGAPAVVPAPDAPAALPSDMLDELSEITVHRQTGPGPLARRLRDRRLLAACAVLVAGLLAVVGLASSGVLTVPVITARHRTGGAPDPVAIAPTHLAGRGAGLPSPSGRAGDVAATRSAGTRPRSGQAAGASAGLAAPTVAGSPAARPPVANAAPAAGNPAAGAPAAGAPVASAAPAQPVGVVSPRPASGPACTARGATTTDYKGRSFSTRYYCGTYVGSAVYANVRSAQAGEALDDSGYLAASNSVWVMCQFQGRSNPVVSGNMNTWWLYTQADTSRANTHGYSAAWGYLPATVMTEGGQNDAVPGVPACASYF
jgi:eukaryotic-like serine/threonine-protein kinase